MKLLLKNLKSIRFIIFVVVGFYFLDFGVMSLQTVETSVLFPKNDYEKILYAHDGTVEHSKVAYGNSVLISAYIEEQSSSGYVNFGMDYATLLDLSKMLKRGFLHPKEDLVLLLNYFVLLDDFDTNPTYPWHRKPYIPYLYFNRDRFQPVIKGFFKQAMQTRKLSPDIMPKHMNMNRAVYYGMMTNEELNERISVHKEKYWGFGIEAYAQNLKALQDIIQYCEDNNVRLRVALAPWNHYIPMPDNPKSVMNEVVKICQDSGVEVYDMTNEFPQKCFHDLGHFNYEYGALRFTEVFDLWLNS